MATTATRATGTKVTSAGQRRTPRVAKTSSVAKKVVPSLTALEVVLSARHGALEPWWHEYAGADRARARELLAAAGFVVTLRC